jgi:hypothetical protein
LHAEELRLIAEKMEAQSGRDTLLEVARDYENMAKSLDAMDRANTASKPASLQQLTHGRCEPQLSQPGTRPTRPSGRAGEAWPRIDRERELKSPFEQRRTSTMARKA